MSSLRQSASADNSLFNSSDAATLLKLNIMSKNLFRNKAEHTREGKEIQSIFTVLNYRFFNLAEPCFRCYLTYFSGHYSKSTM